VSAKPEATDAQPARIRIDRRPIWIILLERSLRPAAFLLLALAFVAVLQADPPAGLTVAGLRALGVFGLCLVLWVTGLLPLAVTSLLAIALVPLAGVLKAPEAYSLFGNEAIFFILGAFILAAAMMRTGLSARLALGFLQRVGTSPRRLLAGVMAATALTCFAMPSHAAAAMVFPIVLEIVRALGLQASRSRYATALLMACAWGAGIGSNLALVSSARAALSIGFLTEAGAPGIPFGKWTLLAAPMVAVQLVAAFAVLLKFFPIDVQTTAPALDALQSRLKAMGKVSGPERLAGLVLLGAITAWIYGGLDWGLANVAVVASVALYVLRVLTWKDAEDYVNWGIFLLYGGAIALGAALDRSGAAAWLADRTLGAWVESPWALVASLSAISVVLSEGISNSAVVAAIAPLAIALGREFSIDPAIPVLAVTMPAGLAFAMPTATPAMALAFSYGGLRVRDTLAAGLVADLVAWLIFLAMAFLWAPLAGYGLG